MIQSQLDLTTPAERQEVLEVLHAIRPHVGRANAISMHDIAQRLSISTREVQSAVKLLVEEQHLPIGTSARRPFGYYWIVTEAERRENRNHFLRRAISTLRHARAFDSDDIVAPLVGQLEIDVPELREEGK